MTQRHAPAMLPLVERMPRAETPRSRLRRFVHAIRTPVPLLDQLAAISHAYLDARHSLRHEKKPLSDTQRLQRLHEIDGLRAARATLARLIETEAAHIGSELAPSTAAAVASAIDDAPTLLEHKKQ